MIKHALLAILGILFTTQIWCQDDFLKSGPVSAANEKEFQEQYDKNIRKSKINGIYIPKDLKDAYREIISLAPEEAIIKFKNGEEDVVTKNYTTD